MPVYFGLPVEEPEVYRLFGIPVPVPTEGTPYYNRGPLRKHLQKYGLEMFYTDKGQFVIGYEITKLGVWAGNDNKSFVPCRKLIYLLNELNHKFTVAMKLAEVDLSVVHLYPMECETYTVNYPEPYIIEWRE